MTHAFGATTPSPERSRLVAGAARRWSDSLVDDSGRNQLAYYRDLKAGTLRLDDARPAALTMLMAGRQVMLKQLFPDQAAHIEALRRAKTIRTRMRLLAEERGVDVGYLAGGLATWYEPDRTPRAPVLLHRLTIRTTSAAETDFALTVDPEPTINPVLLFKLAKEHGLVLDAEDLLDALPEGPYDPVPLFAQLSKLAQDVRGFAVTEEQLIGTFLYEKLPMVADITDHAELLSGSEVIAALAGDAGALASLTATDHVAVDGPDTVAPADEFLVLDADSSQSYAINTVVQGHHLVVKGPPGTGKSQTIANMIMALAARGRTALFVAEKRAAIDAVLDRLAQAGLDDLVQNLHGDQQSRRELARALEARLQRARHETRPATEETDRRLSGARATLVRHHSALHTGHQPWGLSVFELQSRLLGLDPAAANPMRWAPDLLASLDATTAAQLRAGVVELAQLNGFTDGTGASAWHGTNVADHATAQTAFALAGQVAGLLAQSRGQLSALARELALSAPVTLTSALKMLGLVTDVEATLRLLRPEVFGADLPMWIAATATGEQRRGMGFWQRRRAVRQIREQWIGAGRPSGAQLHLAVVAAADQLARWRLVSVDGGAPRSSAAVQPAVATFGSLSQALAQLRTHVSVPSGELTRLADEVDALATDQAGLLAASRRNELRQGLIAWRADRLLTELTARQAGPRLAAAAFDHAWLSSVLDQVRFSDTHLSTFHGPAVHAASDEFRAADVEHITGAAARVRHLAARHLMDTLDEHPEQQQVVRREAAKKVRHLPVRRLFEQAPDALTALKPCWAMSPLLVSQVLPPRVLFDVVIFDEASQVEPVDGVTAIMRGRQVVVAGDEHQLPPTSFFLRGEADSGESLDESPLTDDVESLLQAFAHTLPLPQVRHLAWHYRSRDERLIAFSNTHIYGPHGNALTTFPGADTVDCLRHVLVDGKVPAKDSKATANSPSTVLDPNAVLDRTVALDATAVLDLAEAETVVLNTAEAGTAVAGAASPVGPPALESSSAEVRRVVELILEHARERPIESLGVITMGITHAERIDTALRQTLARHPELEPFFAETGHEPFFIKNIERVQGDERDAVILTVGYPKSADGRVLYRFGPLNMKGGQRRLNVAVTRAKRRMTVVSSFTHLDLDPQRLHAEGARMLRDFLEFAASGGQRLTPSTGEQVTLNPFEADVYDRLTEAGIPLVAQHGVSGYRVDFAAAHPHHPGRLVLAIEADGATYHASPTARDRDRLRQQHLERLGWRFHRIWSTDWYQQREVEIARAKTAYEAALAAIDAVPSPAVPTPPPSAWSAPTQPTSSADRGPRPMLPEAEKITDIPQETLVDLVRWIESDGLNRTEDEVVTEAITELGFQRRGPRIVEALRKARDIAQD